MIMINTAYPKRFNKTTGGLAELVGKVKQSPSYKKWNSDYSCVQGDYQSASEMRKDLLQV